LLLFQSFPTHLRILCSRYRQTCWPANLLRYIPSFALALPNGLHAF
jgi:hypothetical protein